MVAINLFLEGLLAGWKTSLFPMHWELHRQVFLIKSSVEAYWTWRFLDPTPPAMQICRSPGFRVKPYIFSKSPVGIYRCASSPPELVHSSILDIRFLRTIQLAKLWEPTTATRSSRITHKGKQAPDGQVLELYIWTNNCSQPDSQLVTF